MKFTIEPEPFIRILQELNQKASAQRASLLRLSACAPQVYLESNGVAAKTDAVIWHDGACEVPFRPVWRLLLSRRRESEITFQADDDILRIADIPVPVISYTRVSFPPRACQIFLASDFGMVPSRFLLGKLELQLASLQTD